MGRRLVTAALHVACLCGILSAVGAVAAAQDGARLSGVDALALAAGRACAGGEPKELVLQAPAAHAAWLQARLLALPPALRPAFCGGTRVTVLAAPAAAAGSAPPPPPGSSGGNSSGSGGGSAPRGAAAPYAQLALGAVLPAPAQQLQSPTAGAAAAAADATATQPNPPNTSQQQAQQPQQPQQAQQPPRQPDLWLVPQHALADLAAAGAAADVGRLLQADAGSGWWRVLPAYRLGWALHGTSVVAVPLGGGPLLAYARGGTLRGMGMGEQVPDTWQGLLSFARSYPQLRRAGDPPRALCLPQGPDCGWLHLLHAVWASVAQTEGRAQGLYFDPTSLSPRIDTAALRYALRLLSNLTRAAAEAGEGGWGAAEWGAGGGRSAECSGGVVSGGFAGGECAVALATAQQVQLLLASPDPAIALDTLVGPAPGSGTVWDAASDQLLPCTTASCPLGSPPATCAAPPAGAEQLPSQCHPPEDAADPAAAVRAEPPQQQPGAGSGAWGPRARVNRSPHLSAASLTGAVNARSPPLAQLQAYLLLAHLLSPSALSATDPWVSATTAANASALGASSAFSSAGPIASGQLLTPGVPLAGGHGEAPAAGADGAARLAAAVAAVTTEAAAHPNAGWDVSLPGGQVVRLELQQLAVKAAACSALDAAAGLSQAPAAAAAAASCWGSLLGPQLVAAAARVGAAFPPQEYVVLYRSALESGQHHAYEHEAASPSGADSSSGAGVRRSLSIALPVCGALLAVAAAVLLLGRQHRLEVLAALAGRASPLWRARRSLERAPGACADTCLLVTDIESSTTLWEELDSRVMDAAVHLHHDCLRRLLVKHQGYESATEGDSLILAFYRPDDGLAFALEAQAALLELDWPQQLLAHEACHPVWTALPTPFVLASGLQGGRTSGLGLLPLGPRSPVRGASAQPRPSTDSRYHGDSGAAGWGAAGPWRGSLDWGLRLLPLPSPLPQPPSGPALLDGGGGWRAGARVPQGAASVPATPQHPERASLDRAYTWGRPSAEPSGAATPAWGHQQQPGLLSQALSGDEAGMLCERADLCVPPQTLGQWLQQQAALGDPDGEGEEVGELCAAASGRGRLGRRRRNSVQSPTSLTVVFRGLRVRMGLHVGLSHAGEVGRNAASARVVYSGPVAATAKHVSDAVHGGCIALSGPAFAWLQSGRGRQAVWAGSDPGVSRPAARLPPHTVLHYGRFCFPTHPSGDLDVYLAWPDELAARAALLPPPRCTHAPAVPPAYQAPTRHGALAEVVLPHVPLLLAWDETATREALATICAAACAEAWNHGGYLASVPFPDGAAMAAHPAGAVPRAAEGITAAFPSALHAAHWALQLTEALSSAVWPAALLQHPLCCEEWVTQRGPETLHRSNTGMRPSTPAASPMPSERLLLRGQPPSSDGAGGGHGGGRGGALGVIGEVGSPALTQRGGRLLVLEPSPLPWHGGGPAVRGGSLQLDDHPPGAGQQWVGVGTGPGAGQQRALQPPGLTLEQQQGYLMQQLRQQEQAAGLELGMLDSGGTTPRLITSIGGTARSRYQAAPAAAAPAAAVAGTSSMRLLRARVAALGDRLAGATSPSRAAPAPPRPVTYAGCPPQHPPPGSSPVRAPSSLGGTRLGRSPPASPPQPPGAAQLPAAPELAAADQPAAHSAPLPLLPAGTDPAHLVGTDAVAPRGSPLASPFSPHTAPALDPRGMPRGASASGVPAAPAARRPAASPSRLSSLARSLAAQGGAAPSCASSVPTLMPSSLTLAPDDPVAAMVACGMVMVGEAGGEQEVELAEGGAQQQQQQGQGQQGQGQQEQGQQQNPTQPSSRFSLSQLGDLTYASPPASPPFGVGRRFYHPSTTAAADLRPPHAHAHAHPSSPSHSSPGGPRGYESTLPGLPGRNTPPGRCSGSGPGSLPSPLRRIRVSVPPLDPAAGQDACPASAPGHVGRPGALHFPAPPSPVQRAASPSGGGWSPPHQPPHHPRATTANGLLLPRQGPGSAGASASASAGAEVGRTERALSAAAGRMARAGPLSSWLWRLPHPGRPVGHLQRPRQADHQQQQQHGCGTGAYVAPPAAWSHLWSPPGGDAAGATGSGYTVASGELPSSAVLASDGRLGGAGSRSALAGVDATDSGVLGEGGQGSCAAAWTYGSTCPANAVAAPGWDGGGAPEQRVLLCGPRIRVGIHVGDLDWFVPRTSAMLTYVGSTVRRARKLAAHAHFGQVLLSEEAAAQLAAQQLPVARAQLQLLQAAEQRRQQELQEEDECPEQCAQDLQQDAPAAGPAAGVRGGGGSPLPARAGSPGGGSPQPDPALPGSQRSLRSAFAHAAAAACSASPRGNASDADPPAALVGHVGARASARTLGGGLGAQGSSARLRCPPAALSAAAAGCPSPSPAPAPARPIALTCVAAGRGRSSTGAAYACRFVSRWEEAAAPSTRPTCASPPPGRAAQHGPPPSKWAALQRLLHASPSASVAGLGRRASIDPASAAPARAAAPYPTPPPTSSYAEWCAAWQAAQGEQLQPGGSPRAPVVPRAGALDPVPRRTTSLPSAPPTRGPTPRVSVHQAAGPPRWAASERRTVGGTAAAAAAAVAGGPLPCHGMPPDPGVDPLLPGSPGGLGPASDAEVACQASAAATALDKLRSLFPGLRMAYASNTTNNSSGSYELDSMCGVGVGVGVEGTPSGQRRRALLRRTTPSRHGGFPLTSASSTGNASALWAALASVGGGGGGGGDDGQAGSPPGSALARQGSTAGQRMLVSMVRGARRALAHLGPLRRTPPHAQPGAPPALGEGAGSGSWMVGGGASAPRLPGPPGPGAARAGGGPRRSSLPGLAVEWSSTGMRRVQLQLPSGGQGGVQAHEWPPHPLGRAARGNALGGGSAPASSPCAGGMAPAGLPAWPLTHSANQAPSGHPADLAAGDAEGALEELRFLARGFSSDPVGGPGAAAAPCQRAARGSAEGLRAAAAAAAATLGVDAPPAPGAGPGAGAVAGAGASAGAGRRWSAVAAGPPKRLHPAVVAALPAARPSLDVGGTTAGTPCSGGQPATQPPAGAAPPPSAGAAASPPNSRLVSAGQLGEQLASLPPDLRPQALTEPHGVGRGVSGEAAALEGECVWRGWDGAARQQQVQAHEGQVWGQQDAKRVASWPPTDGRGLGPTVVQAATSPPPSAPTPLAAAPAAPDAAPPAARSTPPAAPDARAAAQRCLDPARSSSGKSLSVSLDGADRSAHSSGPARTLRTPALSTGSTCQAALRRGAQAGGAVHVRALPGRRPLQHRRSHGLSDSGASEGGASAVGAAPGSANSVLSTLSAANSALRRVRRVLSPSHSQSLSVNSDGDGGGGEPDARDCMGATHAFMSTGGTTGHVSVDGGDVAQITFAQGIGASWSFHPPHAFRHDQASDL